MLPGVVINDVDTLTFQHRLAEAIKFAFTVFSLVFGEPTPGYQPVDLSR